MKRKISLLLMLTLLLLGVISCTPQPLTLDASDAGTAIVIAPGDQFHIVLDGNPSTGYSWMVLDIDGQVLSQVGDAEFDSAAPNLVGAGGTLRLTFEGVDQGSTLLVLGYLRSWETDVPPLETYRVNVTVE